MINRLVDVGLRVKPQTLVAIYTVIERTKKVLADQEKGIYERQKKEGEAKK